MTNDLLELLRAMRHRLDRAIANGEEPIAELWSQAMEYVEQARRLVVKAGGDVKIYKTVTVETLEGWRRGIPEEESICDLRKPEHKAVAVPRVVWVNMRKRTASEEIFTPFGAIPFYPSDTCPEGSIEWLS